MNTRGDESTRRWRWIAWTATGAYALIVLFVSLHHEAWSDEADSWLVARDAGVLTLFRHVSPMGTPALWYLALMPAAKLGLPFQTMYLINAACCTMAMALVLFHAPWPRIMRLAFVFGFFALFEYGVIARPYGLMMLLLVAVAATYHSRMNRPVLFGTLIALLANVTAHGLVIAAAMGSIFLFDGWRQFRLPRDERARRSRWIVTGLGIALLGGIFAAWQLWPRADAPIPEALIVRNPAVWNSVAASFFYHPRSGAMMMMELSGIVVPLLLPLLLVALLDRPRALFFLVNSLVALLYIYSVKWYQSPRHAGIVLLVVLVSLWLAASEAPLRMSGRFDRLGRFARKGAMGFLTVGLMISIIPAVEWSIADVRGPFAHSAEVARWIDENGRTGEVLAGDAMAATLLPYLNRHRQIWYGHRREWGTYGLRTASDNARILATTPAELALAVQESFPPARPVLLITSHSLESPESVGYEPVFRTTGKAIGYYESSVSYFVYRRNPLPQGAGAAGPVEAGTVDSTSPRANAATLPRRVSSEVSRSK